MQSGGVKMNSITDFVEMLRTINLDLDSYDMFEMIKDNEKLLKKLCGAAIQTYDDIQRIKNILR